MSESRLGKGKKVIFFDLNGTLIQKKKKSAAQAFGEALHQYTARWETEDKAALINKAGKIYSHAIRQYKRKQPADINEKKRKAAIKRAIASLPLPGDDATVASIEKELLAIMNANARVDSKTIAALKRLKRRYRLAVISNGRERAVRAAISRNNLERLFATRAVIASSSLGRGRGKPYPAIFKHALARMRVKPEQALMVGDSWRHDIEGAAACGIDAVWVNPSGKPLPSRSQHASVTSIRKIADLPDIL